MNLRTWGKRQKKGEKGKGKREKEKETEEVDAEIEYLLIRVGLYIYRKEGAIRSVVECRKYMINPRKMYFPRKIN